MDLMCGLPTGRWTFHYRCYEQWPHHPSGVIDIQAMQIRGLTLPEQFVACIESGVLRRDRGSWHLREQQDAYGQHLETELGKVYETPEQIERESAKLSQDFPPEFANLPEEFSAVPGFVPYITDFSRLLTFGRAGDGAAFCFDYRASVEPSIIWWDDAYWRLIAPSFITFISLFRIELNA